MVETKTIPGFALTLFKVLSITTGPILQHMGVENTDHPWLFANKESKNMTLKKEKKNGLTT